MIVDYRLGPYRRNLRDYSVHQRHNGFTAADRLLEKSLRNKIIVFTTLLNRKVFKRVSSAKRRYFAIMVAYYASRYSDLRKPRLSQTDAIPKRTIRLNSYSDQSAVAQFGFHVDDLRRIYTAMHFPDQFELNRGRHKHRVHGEHAFLYFLFRMHSPSQRMTLDANQFGYDYTTLSKMFNVVLRWIHHHFSSLYRIIHRAVPRFAEFNQRIRESILRDFPDRPLPVDAHRVCLFADGTRLRVCRPQGPNWIQKSVYSKHKQQHNHGIQGLMGADGLYYDVYDGMVGRHNDQRFMKESRCNVRMMLAQQGRPIQYHIYTDKGYFRASHVRCAAHGPGPVTALQTQDNTVMAMQRIGVEWNFGKYKARVPYITRHRLLKLQAYDVSMRVRVGFLLTNIHTCLRGSISGVYFGCNPPSLEEYLSYA